MREKHETAIYELVQNTLDFCGDTLQALKEYCLENELEWEEFEYVRFGATRDFYDKE